MIFIHWLPASVVKYGRVGVTHCPSGFLLCKCPHHTWRRQRKCWWVGRHNGSVAWAWARCCPFHLCQLGHRAGTDLRGTTESIWNPIQDLVNMSILSFQDSVHLLHLYIFLVPFPFCATIVFPWHASMTNTTLYHSHTLSFLSPRQ